MSTITREFTKEQLIEHLRSRIEHRKGLIASIHIDRGYRDYLKLELRSSEIALASLEAEPVAWIVHARTGDQLTADGGYVANAEGILGLHSTPLYTTPPAPVSVPDEVRQALSRMDDEIIAELDAEESACRAAMLQGADGNSPVIPDGWVACSERMPEKNERVLIFINFNCDSVPPSIHDAQFTGSTFRRGGATVNVFPLEGGYGVTHWQPLPSPPAK